MQEAVKIEEMGIEDLIERYHIGEEENPYGVSYGEGMVVSHNYIPINIKEKPEVFNHPIRTKFSILFLCTKGNITIRCNSNECRIQANTLFVCKPGSVVQFIDGSLDQASAICSIDKPDGHISLSLQKLLPHYAELEALTLLKLSAHESKKINNMIGYLCDAIKADHDLLFYHEAVKSQVSALMFHFLNIFCSGLNLKKSTQHTAHYRQQDMYASSCRY